MNVTLIGIDLAKTIFQVCGVNQAGKQVFNRQVRRPKLQEYLAQYPEITIAMEACSGSNYLGRTLANKGHKVQLIPAQHVKPFVKGNKNDRNDAFAICEAARRPHLRCVSPKTLEQTDMALVHRIRVRQVDSRTALMNQIRGLLNEYGIVVKRGKEQLRNNLPLIIEDAANELTITARHYFDGLLREWQRLDKSIKQLESSLVKQSKECPKTKRLMGIKGVAVMTATAAVMVANDGTGYKNGRHFSASLGLVPKEFSSGGKQRLGSITKRGNGYLRRLLVQGAWSVIRNVETSTDRLSLWAKKVIERRGKHKAAVAVANKMARIIWAMLYYQTEYRAA